MRPRAVVGLLFGFLAYAFHNFVLYKPDMVYPGETFDQHMGLPWLRYLDVMGIVLLSPVLVGLTTNRLVVGNRAILIFNKKGRAARVARA